MQLFDSDVLRPHKRAINLGGASSSAAGGSVSVLERARLERLQRDQNRRREASAVKIQAAYRSHCARELRRVGLRQELDALLPLKAVNAERLAYATRLLVQLFRHEDTADRTRLAAWCRAAVEKVSIETKRSQWSTPFDAPHDAARWPTTLRLVAQIMLRQIAEHPASPQALLMLEVLKQLLDPARYPASAASVCATLATSLVRRSELHKRCRTHILHFSPERKSSAPTLPSAIQVAMAPLKSLTAGVTRTAALSAFAREILTIPLLPNRLPSSAFTTMTAQLPAAELLNSVTRTPTESEAPYLLANLLALFEQTIPSFAKAPTFVTYVQALQGCLDALPSGSLLDPSRPIRDAKGKGRAAEDPDAMDVDAPIEPPASASQIDPRVRHYLSRLYNSSHLTALTTASNRFASSPTSRPAYCAFLVSLLYSLPKTGGQREDVISLLVYGSGGGMLREIWRGWIRSGKLGRSLGSSKDGHRAVVPALQDEALVQEWPMLVLMVELYSRTLLTLGDDEFFAVGPATASTRNPLSVDEVIGFSALLRNIAFSLYWQEGQLDVQHARIVGTRMTWEELRMLATRTLQQIYARDSRKSFTPSDHWLMTGAFDLASFVQTAIVENNNVNADREEINIPRGRQAVDSDEEDDFAYPRPAVRLQAPRSATVSRREMAFISPRLGVLNNIPFVIPFDTRVQVFRQFINLDREANGVSQFPRSGRRQRAVIRRDHIADDGFAHLNSLGPMLKHRLEIAFIDQYGIEEAGIDGGGLFKEFLTSLSKEAFDTDRGLWLATKNQELYPAPHSYAREARQISWYSFLGRIVGKALYEGILVDVPFAGFFLNKWLGGQNFFDDLASLDLELYNGLVFLKNYTGDVEKDLTLTFSVNDDDFGVSKTIDLIPNGRETPVTRENRYRYIALVSHYRLNAQIRQQSAAFVAGLQEIIDPRWLRLFNQSELRLLVGGAESPIDLDDLKSNTVYGRTMDESSDTVRYFWDVVSTFDQAQRRSLLRFVTSCPRPPLLGFKELYPRFAIAEGGSEEDRLPTASTCMNLLKMPKYTSPIRMKEKLMQAIDAGAGFDLS